MYCFQVDTAAATKAAAGDNKAVAAAGDNKAGASRVAGAVNNRAGANKADGADSSKVGVNKPAVNKDGASRVCFCLI
jgi:hypothetical protein